MKTKNTLGIVTLLGLFTVVEVLAQKKANIGINIIDETGKNLTQQERSYKTFYGFTENKGQVHDQNFKPQTEVLYSGTDGQLTFHFKSSGFNYQQYRNDNRIKIEDPFTVKDSKFADVITIYRVDFSWLNCSKNSEVVAESVLPGYNNYYIESCADGALGARNFNELNYKNLYDGIGVKWYFLNGQLKYDYMVSAGADYKQIKVKVEGYSAMQIDSRGDLIIETTLGRISENAPLVFQNGKSLEAKWKLNHDILSFEINNIDPTLPFVIDPAVRSWGTFYGGSAGENGQSCATDATGNVYLSGFSSQTNTVIATSGSHQNTIGGGGDAFLVKFNSSGIRQWATYYGGTGSEDGRSCTTDFSGNVYLTGRTGSSTGTVIATSGSHQNVFAGGVGDDAYLVKFNSSGVRQWGTYYGGVGNEIGYCCVTDNSGNVYMSGITASTSVSGISTTGAHQTVHGGGAGTIADAFLVKFNSSGVRQWGTYYGGSGNEVGSSCAIDASGNVYLAGQTNSSSGTIIATTGAHQSVYGGGTADGYLVKFNSSGVRQWATYYGGAGDDFGTSCAIDVMSNIYLTGETSSNSGTIIATAGSHQTSLSPLSADAFLVKFNSSGLRQWGTYYGGGGTDQGFSVSTDPTGNIYMSGQTSTPTSTEIATPGSHQPINAGGVIGQIDAFLVKFNSSGTRHWGTYYGGSQDESGRTANSCDIFGNVFLAGTTGSSNGIAMSSLGSHQFNGGGGVDAYLAKFGCPVLGPSAVTNSLICSGSVLSFSGSVTSTLNVNYVWTGPNSYSSVIQSPSISSSSAIIHSGIYTLTVDDADGCFESTTVAVNVNLTPTISVNSGSICNGQYFTITPGGASSYTIQNGANIVSPQVTSSYSIIGTSSAGCVCAQAAISNVTVIQLPVISVNSGSICSGQNFTIIPSGANTYTYLGGTAIVSPVSNTSYSVIGTSSSGCTSSIIAVSNVYVLALPTISTSATQNTICAGQTITLTATGIVSFSWSTGSNANSISDAPLTNTNYIVTGIGTNNCQNTNNFSLSVHPLPFVTASASPSVVCFGDYCTLNGGGANTYSWSGGVINGIPFLPVSNSTYTLTGSFTATGCTNTAVQIVTVKPSPTLSIASSNSAICQGETIVLNVNGANTYTWNNGTTGNSLVVSPNATSQYSVSGTGTGNCISGAAFVLNVDACTSVSQLKNEIRSFLVYPNPNEGVFVIESANELDFNLINSLGQIVWYQKVGPGKTPIDINFLEQGVYFLEMKYDDKLTVKKIIKH